MNCSQAWDNLWRSRKNKIDRSPSWSKKRILAILSEYITPGISVLDAGCGTGFFSSFFIRQGCKTSVLDFSSQALRLARNATNNQADEYLEENLLSPSFPSQHNKQWDIIFSDGLLEHFPPVQQRQLCLSFLSCKKLGGVVIIFVPNLFSPWTIIRPFVMPGIKEKPFTMKRLRKLFQEAGGTIEESGGVNCIPCKWSPEKSMGRYLGMLLYLIGK